MSAKQTCPGSCFYSFPVRRRACGLRVSRAKLAPSRGGRREVLSTHQLHSWGNNLPAHPALYLEPSLGMQTYISGLSATQTKKKKKKKGQEKLVWFQSWTQTTNIKCGLSHWCISVSNITPSSKAVSTGCGSEECFFLLILTSKMCPPLWGDIFCKAESSEANFYEEDSMFWNFWSNIIHAGAVDFPQHVAALEKS